MAPPGQPISVDTPLGGQQDAPSAERGGDHLADQPGTGRQFYIFLLAADVVVLFIYFFLVPNDIWEGLSTRLRSIGALAGSVLSYLGLNLVLQRYVGKLSFLDQTWFRGTVWLVTAILWAAVLPLWRVELSISPPLDRPNVQIVSQSYEAVPAKQKESEAGSKIRYRTCEVEAASTQETMCVLGGLLLRSYEVQVSGAPYPTYLPAASILTKLFTRRPFPVKLPCRVEIMPHVPKAEVYIKQRGEDPEKAPRPLPSDGVLWLMPGPYDYIKITDGNRNASASPNIKCDDQVRIDW